MTSLTSRRNRALERIHESQGFPVTQTEDRCSLPDNPVRNWYHVPEIPVLASKNWYNYAYSLLVIKGEHLLEVTHKQCVAREI